MLGSLYKMCFCACFSTAESGVVVWNNACLAKLLHHTIPGIYSSLVLVFRLAKFSLEWQQLIVILFNVDELSVKTDC